MWTVLDSHIPATIPETLELLLDGGADMFKTNASEQSAYEKVMTSICNTREESRNPQAYFDIFELLLSHENHLRQLSSGPRSTEALHSMGDNCSVDASGGKIQANPLPQVKYGGVSLLVLLSIWTPFEESFDMNYPWSNRLAFLILVKYDVGWISAVDREYFKKNEALKSSSSPLMGLISRILCEVSHMLHYGSKETSSLRVFHCMEGEHANERVISQLISFYIDAYERGSEVAGWPSLDDLLGQYPTILLAFENIERQTRADEELNEKLLTMWRGNRKDKVAAMRWRDCEYCGRKIDIAPWVDRL